MPVISVGNLTWGGNGKTPMVEFLSRSFAEDGISPLILSRVFYFTFWLLLYFYVGICITCLHVGST